MEGFFISSSEIILQKNSIPEPNHPNLPKKEPN